MLSNTKKHKEIKFKKISFNNAKRFSKDKYVNKKKLIISRDFSAVNIDKNCSIQSTTVNNCFKNFEEKQTITENKNIFKISRRSESTNKIFENNYKNIHHTRNTKQGEDEKNDGINECPTYLKIGLEKEKKEKKNAKNNNKNNNLKRCKTYYKKILSKILALKKTA